MSQIEKKSLAFLKKLAKNNNRDWFKENRDEYDLALENLRYFAISIRKGIAKNDLIDEKSDSKVLHRIYRDVRFSKDKSPYKNHFSGGISRTGKRRRGGFYFHIQPGASMIGCGFWNPDAKDLLHIRKQIEADPKAFRKVINTKSVKDNFGGLHGQQLKTSPKGFDKEHESIDLLRFKQFLLYKTFTDKEVLSENFDKEVVKLHSKMLPFLNYMTEMLTHDLNGEPLPDHMLP